MKKQLWKSMISMVMCLAMVVGMGSFPAFAETERLGGTVSANGVSVSFGETSFSQDVFRTQIVVQVADYSIFLKDDKRAQTVRIEYGPKGYPVGQMPYPGPMSIFNVNCNMEGIEIFSVHVSICEGYEDVIGEMDLEFNIITNELKILGSTDRAVQLNGAEFHFSNIEVQNDVLKGHLAIPAKNYESFEPDRIVVTYGPEDHYYTITHTGVPLFEDDIACPVGADGKYHLQVEFSVVDHPEQYYENITLTYDPAVGDLLCPVVNQ